MMMFINDLMGSVRYGSSQYRYDSSRTMMYDDDYERSHGFCGSVKIWFVAIKEHGETNNVFHFPNVNQLCMYASTGLCTYV